MVTGQLGCDPKFRLLREPSSTLKVGGKASKSSLHMVIACVPISVGVTASKKVYFHVSAFDSPGDLPIKRSVYP